jgi:hypothetical protein
MLLAAREASRRRAVGLDFVARGKQAKAELRCWIARPVSGGYFDEDVSTRYEEEGVAAPIAIESLSRSAGDDVRCGDNGSQPERHEFLEDGAMSASSAHPYETILTSFELTHRALPCPLYSRIIWPSPASRLIATPLASAR